MNNLTGTDKSVILLMTIGEDRAAEVFKHLSTREVQALSTAMANGSPDFQQAVDGSAGRI